MKESPLMIKSKAFALDVIKACKELRVTSGYYNDKTLLDKCTEVKRILISSINTAKENMK